MNSTIDCASFFRLIILLPLLVNYSNAAICQDPDDPFGSAGGAMDTADAFAPADSVDAMAPSTTANAASKSGYLDTDPLIRRVRDNPPQTAAEMAQAITWMSQLRSWETVGSLIDRVAALNWSLEGKAQLARKISPDVWSLLLRSTNSFTETQVKNLMAIYGAPAAYARDPRVIDSLIDRLDSSSPVERQLAQLRLQDGQRAALQRLLDRLIEGNNKVPEQILAETALQFGRDGVDALRAACNLQDTTRSSRVALSLAELSRSEFSNELAAALYSNRYAGDIKQSLAEKIQARYARIPSQAAAADFLARSVQSAYDDYQAKRVLPKSPSSTIWLPDASGKIVSREVSQEMAALERLTQLSCMSSQLEIVSPKLETQSAVMQLQRAYQLNPALLDAEFSSQLIQPLSVERVSEAAFWVDIFRQASDRQMHGAAMRCLQALNTHVQSGKMLAPLDFLGELLSDGRPVIRYLALEIINSADPHADYAASERALAVALEMTQLSQGPQVLIVGGNNELCMAAQQMVELHTGSKAVAATSARGAFQQLVQQNPIELIMVVDRVHDMSLYEMLQRLRNSGSLPIAVMVDRLHQAERDLILKGSGFQVSNLSRDPDDMKRALDELTQMLDIRPLTSDDRVRFSVLARNFLTKIAADRNTYFFYPLAQWHEQFVSVAPLLGPQSQSHVLSGLASRESQYRLSQLAAANSLAEQERLDAARAFAASVRQFGLQLGDQEIKNCYALYNQLGPNDPAVAKAMGYVLDIIEAQSGTRQWPDPL